MRRSALLRLAAGLGALALLSAAFPAAARAASSAAASGGAGGGAATAGSLRPLLLVTAATGVGYALAFGTSYQLAPRFSAGCTVALTAGYVSAGAAVLLLDLLIKRGAPAYSDSQLGALFAAVAGVCLAGLAAACALLGRGALGAAGLQGGPSAVGRAARASGDDDGGGKADATDAFAAAGGGAPAGGAWRRHHHHHGAAAAAAGDHSAPPDVEAAPGGSAGAAARPPAAAARAAAAADRAEWRAVARAAAPAAAALLASVATSMAAFPFFAYLPSHDGGGRLGAHAPQAAFYARLAGDVAGRLLPPRLAARTRARLLPAAALKLLLAPPLVAALLRPALLPVGDAAAVALVGVSWVLGGYVNAGAYLLAPSLVPPEQRPRAGGVMALAFQASCLAGLAAAAALQWALRAGGGGVGSGGGGIGGGGGARAAAASAALAGAAVAAVGGSPAPA